MRCEVHEPVIHCHISTNFTHLTAASCPQTLFIAVEVEVDVRLAPGSERGRTSSSKALCAALIDLYGIIRSVTLLQTLQLSTLAPSEAEKGAANKFGLQLSHIRWLLLRQVSR